MGALDTPQKMYKTWTTDSTRWDQYNPRDEEEPLGFGSSHGR